VHEKTVDLPPGDARLPAAWAVMAALRPHRDAAAMEELYAQAHPLGLRITALLLVGDAGDAGDAAVCAVAGWRIGINLHLGRNLYVEDLVTDPRRRSAGHGALLLEHLRERARAAGCAALHLDSGVERHDAHRFYFRAGMHISSHHFMEDLH
jgi:GNAT superfamily N-acetyltransferase